MREASGNQNHFAGSDGVAVHHAERLIHDARQGFPAEHLKIKAVVESHQQIRFFSVDTASAQHDPGFRFAVGRVKKALRCCTVGVRLNRQPDGGVKQFSQKTGSFSCGCRMIRTEQRLGFTFQYTVEQFR